MAKQKKATAKTQHKVKNPKITIHKQPITETLELNYMPYAVSVIVSRAIPEIDGFKPAHRKLLYMMYKMGLLTGNRTKSANIVGQTMKLSPHGDMAIYETMVRLTRSNEALLIPFIDSKGNFGKQYSRNMSFAAPRYTEAKLEPVCAEIFKDIDKDNVDFITNYDNTLKEPILLPTTFPNILANPNHGIAVGMASTICSFNLTELCEATSQILKGKKINLIDIMPAPDFSTGGEILYDKKEMEQIYQTGKGSFKIRAKYLYDKKNNCIEIIEIPYSTTIEAIIEKIVDLMRKGKAKEIVDVRDETDLKGLKITIDLKKDSNVELLMQKLFKFTPLEDTFTCNFNVLISGRPQILGVQEILDEWIAFRVNCVKRSSLFDIARKQEKLHLLQGLKAILLNIDKAIKIIKNSQDDNEVIANLVKGFKIDKIQAEFIADIKLRNLNKNYIIHKTSEIEKLIKEIAQLEKLASDDKKIKKFIATELLQVSKKHGQPRKTTYIHYDNVPMIQEEDTIENYPCKIIISNSNYLKKIHANNYAPDMEIVLKDEDDFIMQVIACNNKDDILFFTNLGNVYKSKVYDLLDSKPSVLGEYLPNLLQFEPNERVTFVCCTADYSEKVLFFFENGKATKIPLSAYQTKTRRRKLLNAISIKSSLKQGFCVGKEIEILITMSNRKKHKIHSKNITEKVTKNNQGTQLVPIGKKTFIKSIVVNTKP